MLVLLFASLLACTGTDKADTGTAPPTLTRIQTEVFTASCAFSSCHGGSTGSGDLDLTDGAAHASLVGVESAAAPGQILVVAGDAAGSYLVQKCAAQAGIVGEPMPDGDADGLDAERLALLEAWIDAGALDD